MPYDKQASAQESLVSNYSGVMQGNDAFAWIHLYQAIQSLMKIVSQEMHRELIIQRVLHQC